MIRLISMFQLKCVVMHFQAFVCNLIVNLKLFHSIDCDLSDSHSIGCDTLQS